MLKAGLLTIHQVRQSLAFGSRAPIFDHMPAKPPPFSRVLHEGLSIPRLLVNPLRRAKPGETIGEGRAVLVIPGLATGDVSTILMRKTLAERGFRPEGWRLGLNTGGDAGKLRRLEARIERMHVETGRKVILIGWSLGGLYARVLAHRIPQHLAMVLTVASPFSGDRHANHGWRFYDLINSHTVDNPPFAEDFAAKPPIPTVAVWSGLDGIVAPECTRGEAGQADLCIRLDAPHFALGTSRWCIERIIEAIALGDDL